MDRDQAAGAPPTSDPAPRWPTGLLTLIGLAVGALVGLAAHWLPVGMAGGVAVGVGLDSLANHWLNAAPDGGPDQEGLS